MASGREASWFSGKSRGTPPPSSGVQPGGKTNHPWGGQDEEVLRSGKWSQTDDEALPATHPTSRNPVLRAKKMPYLSAELSQVSVTCSQKNSDDLSPWIAMR